MCARLDGCAGLVRHSSGRGGGVTRVRGVARVLQALGTIQLSVQETCAGMTTGESNGSDGSGERGSSRRKLSPEQEREVTRLYAETQTPVPEISKRFGIGESSVYRVAQRHGAQLRGRTTGGSQGGGGATPPRGGEEPADFGSSILPK